MIKKVLLTFSLLTIAAYSLSGQGLKVSLQAKNESYAVVFKEIEQQTGYSFLVNESELDTDEKLSVDFKDESLEKALTSILSAKDLTFSLVDKNIVIKRKEHETKTVSGIVVDNDGVPLVGVAVVVKGTSEGVSTDSDGKYNIQASPSDILEFMFLGFMDYERQVGEDKVINVEMKPDNTVLDDVVVIGYGSAKKSDLTGSVASIKADTFEARPVASVDGLLQGKVAGLQVVQSSGEPGASVEIRLRGVSSRQGSNSPLYVVDGFPYGDAGALKQINVNDIASIEVLKDASAASIYGSRGANGVIMITTKSGEINKRPTISIATNTGVQWVNTSNFGIIKDPYLYALLSDEARVNDSRIGVPKYIGAYDDSGFYFPSLTEIQSGAWDKTTDWSEEVLKPALIQNYNISVSGGGKTNAYMLSASYFNQDGTLIGSGYESVSTRFKFDQNVGKKLKIGTNLSFSYVNRDLSNITYSSLYRNPVFPVYNEDGSYYKEDPTDMTNPVMLANEVKNHSDGYDFYTVTYLNWDICKGLSLRAQSGLKFGASISDKYYPRTTTLGDQNKGQAELENYLGTVMLNEVYATYKNKFGRDKKHDFSAMLGYSSEVTSNRGSGLVAVGFSNDNLTNENMSMGDPQKNKLSNYQQKEVLSSFVSRINYTYDDRYIVTFTGRFDGSSKFGSNNKYGFFPSVAVGWKIASESFVKDNITWLNELKLRASYGSTGNQAISVYGTKDKISGTLNDKYYDGNTLVSGLGLTQMGNNSLRWETTRQANIGIDLGVLDNAIVFSMDLYDKNTTGLLRQRSLPLSGGIGNHHNGETGKVWVNSGELNNRGIEFTFNARIFGRRDFTWNVNATASHNLTVVKDIGEEGESMGLLRSRGDFSDGGVYWRNGLPMDVIVGYLVDGIIQTGEQYTHLTGDDGMPGEFIYRDLNNDGELTADDMQVLGNAQPKWIVGFGTTLTYKGFDLDVQFNGMLGHDVISQQKFSNAKQVNRWTVDNPTQNYPRLRGGRNLRLSDWWIEDASFVRISNITFGYTFDPNRIKCIKGLRLFFNCANPYVFTSFSGIDPEVSIWDTGTYPKPTTFSLGINLDF